MIEKFLRHGMIAGMEFLNGSILASAATANLLLRRFNLDEEIMTDSEYSRYRLKHPVKKILDENEERLLVITAEGNLEEWAKPRWRLANKLRYTPTRSVRPL